MLTEENFQINILIVDDSDKSRFHTGQELKRFLNCFENMKLNILEAQDLSEMREKLEELSFNVVLLDRDLGVDEDGKRVDGTDSIAEIIETQPRAKVIMLTSSDRYTHAAKAIRAGALAYVTKGVDEETGDEEYRREQILAAIRQSKDEMDFHRHQFALKAGAGTGVAYKSDAMKKLQMKLQMLAGVSTPVLFTGATGLGKTHAAERLSRLSKEHFRQRERIFLDQNINEIPAQLLEARLFGSEKGSYTGSIGTTQGLFEYAKDGDLFLDEIGDASLDLQAKLLTVIEKRKYRRVGGNKDHFTNARVIFATNKNLEKMVEEGTFREDLYARICTVTIEIPSLEDRVDDIPFICETLCEKLSTKAKKISFFDFPENLKEHFTAGNFRLNIRGIRNDLERLFIFCPQMPDNSISYKNWRELISGSKKRTAKRARVDVAAMIEGLALEIAETEGVNFVDVRDRLESKAITRVCKKHKTNVARARALGLSEGNTSNKIKKFLAGNGSLNKRALNG